jgi:signal transduction histidine kinase
MGGGMTGPEPVAFLWALFALTMLGALLPLDVGRGRQDYVVLTIAATFVLGVLGPRGLWLIWGPVVVACLARRGGRWLVGTAAAITVGCSLATITYVGILGRDFPLRIDTGRNLAVADLVMTTAWIGTMSVRVLLHRLTRPAPDADAHEVFDAFDSPLVPYLLPTVAGAPILVGSVALYRPEDPWPALVALLWCLPVYAACRFELHRQRLARQLRHAAESRQRLAAIGEVTARIVHQSRHQAGLMGWSLHRLRRLVGDPSEEAVAAARHELDILTTAKQRIQETLDSELLQEPPREPRADAAGPPTIASVVEDVCGQLDDKARQGGIAIELDVDPATGALPAPAALREALFNVVDNATDAATTVVRVTATTPSGPGTSPGTSTSAGNGNGNGGHRQRGTGGSEVVVLVSDDGPGIASEAAGRLYEPFFSTKPDGSGMGLAIADALVAELGGHLRHERVDGTTVFRLCLSTPAAASRSSPTR